VDETGLGRVYHAPFDVVLSDYDVVEPDLLVVLNDQLDIVGPTNVRGATAIVVEILSPGGRHRDEVVKRELYARAGVREYWIVDPDGETVTRCRQRAPGVLETSTRLSDLAGDSLTSQLLPGFSLALAALFRA
jgi:Uma2 family endonuclease